MHRISFICHTTDSCRSGESSRDYSLYLIAKEDEDIPVFYCQQIELLRSSRGKYNVSTRDSQFGRLLTGVGRMEWHTHDPDAAVNFPAL